MFDADRSLGASRWPVVRLVPGSKTELVLCSVRFFSLTTHWNRCTVACSGDDCALCDLLPSRGLFYLAGVCAGTLRMMELGSQSASHLEQHVKLLHGGFRPGQVIEFSRRTAKSPVFSEVVRVQENVQAVSHIALATHVLALYKFPPPNPGDTIEQYEARVREFAKLRNRRAADALLTKAPNGRV